MCQILSRVGRTALAAGFSLVLLAAREPAAPTSPAPATTRAAETKVTIDNFAFAPREVTIDVGATVTWVNRDDVPHTATCKDKPREFDSKTLDTDGTYSHRFSKPGTYPYFCAVHPHMTATIIVK